MGIQESRRLEEKKEREKKKREREKRKKRSVASTKGERETKKVFLKVRGYGRRPRTSGGAGGRSVFLFSSSSTSAVVEETKTLGALG